MILVDTSVWIDLLNGHLSSQLREDDLFDLATCGPVVQEVLQGLKDHPAAVAFRQSLLALPVLGDPLAVGMFEAAAEIYRQGRKRGFTIRSSMDCLIAAIAIESQTSVWHKDRDFDVIARFTPLQIHRPKSGLGGRPLV